MSTDHVDTIVQQWNRERPDLDVSGMAILGRLARLNRAARPLLDAVFSRHELESWEFDVLATLRRHGDPYELTPGRLLDATMITSGAMTNRLDRLEQRGLISRSKSPHDGRQVLVRLTDAGRTMIDAAVTDHALNEERIVAGLTERQQAQLVDLLRRLDRSIDDAAAGT